MEDTPVLKWTLAALGVIVACFCLGYFVLGPNPRQQRSPAPGSAQVTEVADASTAPSQPRLAPKPAAIVVDQTSEVEAKLKKLELEKQKALDAQKKAEEALRQKELAALNSPSPSPSVEVVEASPSPDASASPDAAVAGNTDTTAPATPPVSDPTPDTHTLVKPIAAHAPPAAQPTPEPTKPPAATMYKVQVGPFSTREAANTVAAELRGRGFSTSFVHEESGSKGTFRIQVGAYKSKSGAESTLRELQANGYDAALGE